MGVSGGRFTVVLAASFIRLAPPPRLCCGEPTQAPGMMVLMVADLSQLTRADSVDTSYGVRNTSATTAWRREAPQGRDRWLATAGPAHSPAGRSCESVY